MKIIANGSVDAAERLITIKLYNIIGPRVKPQQQGFVEHRLNETNLMKFTHFVMKIKGQIDVFYWGGFYFAISSRTKRVNIFPAKNGITGTKKHIRHKKNISGKK